MRYLSAALAIAGLLSVSREVATQAAPPPTISESQLIQRLTDFGDSLAALDRFSGVVLLAKAGKPVFEHAYGLADRTTKRRNDIETAFNLGSINKAFTATAIRQLAAVGKLFLDSTLAFNWKDYPNGEIARRVTIRQLLQMQSGIGGDIFVAPTSGRRVDLRHNRDFLPLFVNRSLDFEPGSDRRYSNAGYVVLGMLVERASGEDYYDYVRRHIYEPAGMTRTGHYAIDSLPPNTAAGWTRGDEDAPSTNPLRSNAGELPGRGSAAGGGYSTAHDLMRFVQALRERRIPDGSPPGLGIAGGSGGVNAVIEGDLPGGYDLIVLANMDPPIAERIAEAVRSWLGVKDEQ